ncbi:MAG: hypothetical protein PUB18_04900 [bacterium]|nr:hypothetical protein [bacterium]
MKFTFQKYKIKVIILALVTIALFIGIYYFFTSIDLFIAYFILVMLGILMLRIGVYYFSLINFLKKHSKEEIKDFEKELSNVLVRYGNCFLTEKYIFSLEKLNYIDYQEIICLDSSVGWINHKGELFRPGRKTILYLKDGKKYIIKTPIALFTTSYCDFVKLVKRKNHDIFIGHINDYEREKDNIEQVKKIKSKARL